MDIKKIKRNLCMEEIIMIDTIYSLFENTVSMHKNETAIIENNRTMTFEELSNLVDIIAGSFPKEVNSIGIVMSHRAEMIASMLAALKCGAMYVPAEPTFPTGRIHYMMEEANVDFILTEKTYTNKLEGFELRLTDCEICGMETPISERKNIQNPMQPAYVLYTSGTTGRPKGVCVTNRNVCHYIRAFANEFKPTVGDVMLQYSVCSFDIFVEEVYASLLNGATLAIPSEEDKININTLMEFVNEVESYLYQCTDVQQAIVRAFTDENGLSYMTAYIVPLSKNIKLSTIKKELEKNLTPFMIPEFIVKMPNIPLNTNGKPDIAKLPIVMKEGNF